MMCQTKSLIFIVIALLIDMDLSLINDDQWRQISLFAEHNELTMDYVLSEFVIDDILIVPITLDD